MANLAALLVVIIYFLGFNIPLSQSTASPQVPVKVMTYNIRYGSRGIGEIIRLLKNESPDIVCLQEVLAKDGWPDPLQALQEALPEYSVARYGELVTFSHWPIKGQHIHRLPRRNGSGVLETQVIINGEMLRVLNVHFINLIDKPLLNLPQGIQKRTNISNAQFALLHRLARQNQSSYLITGDFNLPPRRHLANSSFSGLGIDVFKARGWGFGNTYPAFFPVVRIDYLWSSKNLKPLSCRVISSRASDHRAVIAQLALK